jgi:hypothetical protein
VLFAVVLLVVFARPPTPVCTTGLAGSNIDQACRLQSAPRPDPAEEPSLPLPPPATPPAGMSFPFGPVIRQPALGRHTGSVILLHGLGDTGEGAYFVSWAACLVGMHRSVPCKLPADACRYLTCK